MIIRNFNEYIEGFKVLAIPKDANSVDLEAMSLFYPKNNFTGIQTCGVELSFAEYAELIEADIEKNWPDFCIGRMSDTYFYYSMLSVGIENEIC